MHISQHSVVIVGAGPTGLTLAAELALAGVDAVILERRETPDLAGMRAGGLHARTIEMLDQRGIAGRFLSEGQIAQVAAFAGTRLSLEGFPTRHPYGLGLWQADIERLLAGWAEALSVPLHRGAEVTDLSQDGDSVEVALADGRRLRADYLVGCDGGRSLIRKAAGIDFPGWDPTTSSLIAEVEMREEPPMGVHANPHGLHSFGRTDYEIRDGKIHYKDAGPVRVMVTERRVALGAEPTLRELSEALIAACGTDYGLHAACWISRFTDATRQAASYRQGRVLLAGDAAHVHAPDGGQGLNLGVQDAMNLGWKLAQVVRGVSPDSLLDSYHAERHPVAARVLRATMAAVALRRPDDRSGALREAMTELLGMEEPRKHFAGMMSGLDIRYNLGPGHPLLGRRMPDLDLRTREGGRPVYSFLHEARPLLLNLGTPGSLDITPWTERVNLVEASYDGMWALPVIGEVPAPSAVLIRPDGYVAWVSEGSPHGLAGALERWIGAPAAA